MSRKQYSRYVLVVDNLSSNTPSSGGLLALGRAAVPATAGVAATAQLAGVHFTHRCRA